jgi:hypothetical protein
MSTQGDSPCAGAQPDSGGRHTAAQRFRLLTHPPLPPSSCHRQLIPGLPARAAAPPPSTSLERGSTTDTPIRPAAKRLVASCPRAPPLLPSARQRASILGSWAVADKATALGVSESGTLPARACAVGAGGPRQGLAVACAERTELPPTVGVSATHACALIGDSLVTRGNRTVRNCRPV